MEKKYQLTDDTKNLGESVLHRIISVRDFGEVKKGALGGYIESESNLSHEGKAWVCGDAVVSGDADYIVFKNFWSSGRYFTWTRSDDMWTVGCFHGTGEELIAKAYKDSEESGRNYERVVHYVETLKNEEFNK